MIFGLLAVEGVFSHLSVATAAEPPGQAAKIGKSNAVPQDLQTLPRFLQYFQGPVWWHSARKAIVDGVHLSVTGTPCTAYLML